MCAPEQRTNHVDHVRSRIDREGSLVLHLACLLMNFSQLRDAILVQPPPPSPSFSRVLLYCTTTFETDNFESKQII